MTSNFEKTSPKIKHVPLERGHFKFRTCISQATIFSCKLFKNPAGKTKFSLAKHFSQQLCVVSVAVSWIAGHHSPDSTGAPKTSVSFCTFYLLLLLHFLLFFSVKLYICWTIPTHEIRPKFSHFVGCQKNFRITTFSIWDLFVCNPIVIGDIVGWLAPDFPTTSQKLWLGRSHAFVLRGFLMEFLLDSKLLIQRSQDKDFFQPVCYQYTYVFTWIIYIYRYIYIYIHVYFYDTYTHASSFAGLRRI